MSISVELLGRREARLQLNRQQKRNDRQTRHASRQWQAQSRERNSTWITSSPDFLKARIKNTFCIAMMQIYATSYVLFSFCLFKIL